MAKFHVILNVKKGKIGTFDIFFPLSTEHSLFVSVLGSHGHDVSIRVIKEELEGLCPWFRHLEERNLVFSLQRAYQY